MPEKEGGKVGCFFSEGGEGGKRALLGLAVRREGGERKTSSKKMEIKYRTATQKEKFESKEKNEERQ